MISNVSSIVARSLTLFKSAGEWIDLVVSEGGKDAKAMTSRHMGGVDVAFDAARLVWERGSELEGGIVVRGHGGCDCNCSLYSALLAFLQ